MIIKRGHRTTYTTIANEVIEDERLSYEALGLLSYLLSRPENWEVHIDQLRSPHQTLRGLRRERVGRDKIYRIVGELKDAGYMEYVPIRTPGGQVSEGSWIVREQPKPNGEQNSNYSLANELDPARTEQAKTLDPAQQDPAEPNPARTDAYKGLTGSKNSQVDSREGADARGRQLAISPIMDDDDIAAAQAAIERIWPPGSVGNRAKARGLLADMEPVARKAAWEAAPRYLRALRSENKRYTPLIETYLTNKDFDRFPEPTGADAPVPTIELKPYSRELWLLFWNAVTEAIKGGEERHFNRVRDRLGQLTRGLVTPIAAVPGAEELGAMFPIVVGSPEHEAWATYGERIGVSLPRPDIAPVIFAPTKAAPHLRLGWKQYRLARPTSCSYRDRVWWWRVFQIDDGDIIETQLREGAGHAGACPVYFGPWPVSADLAAMVEIKQGSDQWGSWERWFDSKGIWLRWPDPSMWAPSEYPAVFGEQERARA